MGASEVSSVRDTQFIIDELEDVLDRARGITEVCRVASAAGHEGARLFVPAASPLGMSFALEAARREFDRARSLIGELKG